MTTIEMDHCSDGTSTPAKPTAGTQPGPLRPAHLVGIAAAVLVAAIGATVVYVDTKIPPATSGVIPKVSIEVGGDVARTSGTVLYTDGSKADLQQGEATYTAELSRGTTVRTASVAVVSGFNPAWCLITVDGQFAVRVDAEAGGELALCTWVP